MKVIIERANWVRVGQGQQAVNFTSQNPKRDIKLLVGSRMCASGFLAKTMFDSLGLDNSMLEDKNYPSEAGLDFFRTKIVKSANGQEISVERELARINDRRIPEYQSISDDEQEKLLKVVAADALGINLTFV